MNYHTQNIHDALYHYFGFQSFLDNQEDIIREILAGQDICVIMPTGAGKSLCYQLPILMRQGYGIIVSPLISLMKDQVDALRARNIPAGYINSSIPVGEQQRIIADTAEGRLKLLYVAPERFQMDSFRHLLQHLPPHTMVIDEAHCISQWGHDFRPSYLRIGGIASEFAIPQLCAFTATATPQVREDIRKQLHRHDMQLHVAGFKRPNLAFSVVNTSTAAAKLSVLDNILQTPAPTIIYASTRKAVDEVATTLKCRAYHAGMSDTERADTQDYFMSHPCPVLAATNAFGMGIDRPDVRRVIHYNITGSLEAYYQEAGRAGRDGEGAECILLHSYADRYTHDFLIELNNPPEEIIRSLHRVLRKICDDLNTDTLEISFPELLKHIPDARSDGQLASAMQILEKYGHVRRDFRQDSNGSLRFTANINELRQTHAAESTQRSRFISRAITAFGPRLIPGIKVSYGELVRLSQLNIEQLKRVLHALNGECLSWTPPFSGKVTTVINPYDEKLNIDFKALRDKFHFEQSRLEDVIRYTATPGCRQRFLIEYFGENADQWLCGSCDSCAVSAHSIARQPDSDELAGIQTILKAVTILKGRFGRGKISQILAGRLTADIAAYGLEEHPCFGLLEHLKQNHILLYLKALEDADAIHRTGDPQYPCLAITPFGKKLIAGQASISLDFPRPDQPAKKKKSPVTDKPGDDNGECFSEDAELYSRLSQLRARLAAESGVPHYQIFSNATLKEMSHRKPVTIDEAREIKGVGPEKARRLIPDFLSEIRAWRQENPII